METKTEETAPADAAEDVQARVRELTRQGRTMMRLYDTDGYEEAVALLQQALELDKYSAQTHAVLAETYSYWGFRRELNGQKSADCYKRACEHAECSLALAPESAESHRAMAVALRRGERADPERRKEEILVAMDLEPNNPENWYEYWRAFGYDPSDPTILRALDVDPGLIGARIDLGAALAEEGRDQEALQQLLGALKVCPGHSLALYDLAMMLDRVGERGKAVAALERARQLHPGDALIERGWKLLNGGDHA